MIWKVENKLNAHRYSSHSILWLKLYLYHKFGDNMHKIIKGYIARLGAKFLSRGFFSSLIIFFVIYKMLPGKDK
jgi:hypothetical protein